MIFKIRKFTSQQELAFILTLTTRKGLLKLSISYYYDSAKYYCVKCKTKTFFERVPGYDQYYCLKCCSKISGVEYFMATRKKEKVCKLRDFIKFPEFRMTFFKNKEVL